MESLGASPETALELIAKVGKLTAEAIAAVTAAMGSAEPETLCAALSNVADGLMEASAGLRNLEVPAGAFARARRAGEADGFGRGYEQGRRARTAHLALVHRAAG